MSNRAERIAEEEEEEEEDGENWLASFSDLMADLLALFVILFSFAMLNQAHANAQGNPNNMIPIFEGQSSHNALINFFNKYKAGDSDILSEQEDYENNVAEAGLADVIASVINNDPNLVGEVSLVRIDDYNLIVRFNEKILFRPGSANILPEALPVLEQLSSVLKEFEPNLKMIRIEGHTDTQPINTVQFPSNWELSSIRAANVLRMLISYTEAIKPEKFSAVGYGEFHPIADNDIEEGRQKNRRVDFFMELFSD